MNKAQKDKRELKEVVNVFLSKAPPKNAVSIESPLENSKIVQSQVISFCSPFRDHESFLLNLVLPPLFSPYFKVSYFATKPLLSKDLELLSAYTQLSLTTGSTVRREKRKTLQPNFFWVTLPEKKDFDSKIDDDSSSFSKQKLPMSDCLVVLDLNRSTIYDHEHMIQILDHLVLIVRPEIDDMKNAYKIIKACYYVNRQLEISIIFNAEMTQTQVEEVFSKFSDMISHFLALPIRCLGAHFFQLESMNQDFQCPKSLLLDTLVEGSSTKKNIKMGSLEKIRFLQKLNKFLGE